MCCQEKEAPYPNSPWLISELFLVSEITENNSSALGTNIQKVSLLFTILSPLINYFSLFASSDLELLSVMVILILAVIVIFNMF